MSRFEIRDFRDSDFEADSRIASHLHPGFPVTAEEIRHWDGAIAGEGIHKHRLAVEERDSATVVATGLLFNPPWEFDPDAYWMSIEVDPSRQGQGIGRSLFRVLEDEAISRAGRCLWATVLADQPRSVRFFGRAGFTERRRTWTSVLGLTQEAPAPAPADPTDRRLDRIEFTSVAREGPEDAGVRARLHRLDNEAGRDTPRLGPSTELSREQFDDLVFRGPGYFPEGILLAKSDGEYVAYTYLIKRPSNPDTLHVGFTGTLRAFRGRGIATELKRQAAELARSMGYRFLRTNNDSQNPAIWAINEKLGFRQVETWIEGEKGLPPAGDGGIK
ncbi:MAG TPA: GNAT family N-acetyltransferase [Thermoplasmata archaeon]|nr:GNAT family N-acetyltransferase [Thermoplasmata archaeon]